MCFTILGGFGFIGSALAECLRGRGHEVNVPPRNGSEFHKEVGHVVWCIGLTAGFRTRPHATVDAHVSLLNTFLEQAKYDSLLYLSSTRVYQGSSVTLENASLQVRPEEADQIYNLTKLSGECLCLLAGGANCRIARLSNIVGPRESERDTFVGAICRASHAGRIELKSHLDSAKDYLYIDDAVRYLALIAEGGCHQIYNVASGKQTRHKQWISQLQKIAPCTVVASDGLPCEGFPRIDVGRLTAEFGPARIEPLSKVDEIASQV